MTGGARQRPLTAGSYLKYRLMPHDVMPSLAFFSQKTVSTDSEAPMALGTPASLLSLDTVLDAAWEPVMLRWQKETVVQLNRRRKPSH